MSDRLFAKIDGFQVMEGQKQQIRAAIAGAPSELASLPDADVIAKFVAQYRIDVPVLDEANMTTSQVEVDLDVSRDHRRFFMNRGVPFYVKGTKITVHVPFSGEGALFDVQPNMFSSTMPRGVVEGQELQISFSFPNDLEPPNIKSDLDTNISQINQYLSRLREMADAMHQELQSIASQAWQNRKKQFELRRDVLSNLGLPQRKIPPPRPPLNVVHAPGSKGAISPSSNSITQTWDAFISHASEDKEDFVKPLAIALRASGLNVWYDEYTLAWGDSLRAKIDEGLAKSRFGIVVLSPAFFAKHWPQQELNGLSAREVGGKKVILPVWHNITRERILEFSPTLADRLAVKSTDGIKSIANELHELLKV